MNNVINGKKISMISIFKTLSFAYTKIQNLIYRNKIFSFCCLPFKSKLQKLCLDMDQIINSLNKVIETNDIQFVQLGESLQKVYGNVNDLSELTFNTAKLITYGSQDSLLSNISKLVQIALDELLECQSKIVQCLDIIKDGDHQIKKLCSICNVMKKSGDLLNMIGMNISIESSRYTESREMFQYFSKDIRELAKEIINIEDSLYENSETLLKSQNHFYKDIVKSLEQLNRLTQNAKSSVKNALSRVENLITLSSQALEKANSHSTKISKHINEIVMGIQFHDITKQQTEHIISALCDINNIIKTSLKSRNLNDKKSINKIYTILTLQIAHLNNIINEIESAYNKFLTSFDLIYQEIEGFSESISFTELKAYDKDESKNPFLDIHASLNQLHDLICRGAKIGDKMNNIIKQTSSAISRLSLYIDKVNSISNSLKIKALNSIIMTAHLGNQGMGLEVLAQEVKTVSDSSNEFVDDVLQIINIIMQKSDTLGKISWETDTKNSSAIFDVQQGIDMINNVYNDFQKGSVKALNDSNILYNSIENIKLGLNFLSDLICQLKLYRSDMEKIAQDISLLADIKQIDIEDAIHDKLSQNYTMKSERSIHHNLVTDSIEIDDDQESSNIEFFEDDINIDEFSTDENSDNEFDDNVELF